jgi:Holliday junction DNA helicase RuvA
MITRIRGIVESIGQDNIELTLGHVTVQVQIPQSNLQDLGVIGDEVHLYTYVLIKDEKISIYGFKLQESLTIFQLLINVSGVGPKSALNIVSDLSPEALAMAITSGNSESINKIRGIGQKTADRIILELKSKLQKQSQFKSSDFNSMDADVVAALGALGYSLAEINKALSGIATSNSESLDERIRKTLQKIGNR